VREVASQTGRNDDGTDPYGPNRNELFVALRPYDAWPRGKLKADLVEELAERLKTAIPGGFFSFTQPIIDNVTEAVTARGPGGHHHRAPISANCAGSATRPSLCATCLALPHRHRAGGGSVPAALVPRPPGARAHGLNVRDVQDVIES
jgi:cobalt-zinc-cadmium resistance protein CzcA